MRIRLGVRLILQFRDSPNLGLQPFTEDIAEHDADLCAEFSMAGTMVPRIDLVVAATARALGFGLLVGPDDEANFRREPGPGVHVAGM